jgi:arsenate reductase (thioredoxin)
MLAELILMAAGASAPAVVFVCEHGSVKSLIAQEWFNRRAAERGLALRAVSRGTAPDAAVPPAIVEALRRDGFDVTAFQPRALAAGEGGAARVVAIGVDREALPSIDASRLERWEGIPPASQDYAAARDAIKARIEALIDALAGAAKE